MGSFNFHGEDVAPSEPEEALFHFIPVPLEQSVSYEGGTANGPEAILEASCQLELLENSCVPTEKGVYTAPAIDCQGDIEDIISVIRLATAASVGCGGIPVLLGGEHTVTLGAIQAMHEKYGTDFGIVQFDAHADLRDSYTGTKYSHASVLRRVHEMGIPVYQIGTRSYSSEENEYRKAHSIWYKDAEEVFRSGESSILLPEDCPKNIYITFDVDAFDTAIMPATGTPVPGGLDWYQVVWMIKRFLEGRRCIGMDFVELAPIEGFHGYDFAVAQLIHRVMSYIVLQS